MPAVAKSFSIAGAEIEVVVEDDGALHITEFLTYDFSGSFSGAYRDIPLKFGETFEFISVGDEGGTYDPGGCAWLGCSSPAGMYGLDLTTGQARVVWHHSSNDTTRTFKLVYRLRGVINAYDDVADLNLQVWGDQWSVRADRVAATAEIPTGAAQGDVLVFGHPYGVDGATSLGADGVSPSLEATGVPAHQFVELRVVFPTDLLSSTGSVNTIAGNGLDIILAEEEEWAQEANDAREAARNGAIAAIVAFVAIVGGLGGLVYWVYGREPRTGYDQEYEHAPPTDLTPAEVGVLLSQGGIDEKQFTATLFDLISRGIVSAEPSNVQRVTWGGLKTEAITDLVLAVEGDETGLRDFEQSVMTVLRRALELGPRPLHELNEAIREDATANASTYQTFRSRVIGAVSRGGLLDTRGHGVSWLVRIGAIVVVIGAFWVFTNTLADSRAGAAFSALLIAGMVAGALVLFVFLSFRRVRTKRTQEGALEAERWFAFKRYLEDFSRLEEAPSISLELWDRFLVYGITLGVAEQVLEQARINAPPELQEVSSIYWYGNYGYGGGPTQNAFAGLESALSGAFTPPSSSSGGGGGFSGGGGGGSGGGGGGAW